MTLDTLSKAGGIFAALTFWHLICDWLFQTQDTIEHKAADKQIRFGNSLLYAIFMLIPLHVLRISVPTRREAIMAAIMIASHYTIDSTHVVLMWAKYLRKSTHVKYGRVGHWMFNKQTGPLASILVVTIDQLVHIICLWPIVYILMYR